MSDLTYKSARSRGAAVLLSYAAGMFLLVIATVAAAVIYVFGSELIQRVVDINIEQQAPWFRDTFLTLAVGIICAVSTLAVNDILGDEKPYLWGWPLAVVAFAVLGNGLMGDGWVVTSEAVQQGVITFTVVVVLRLRERKCSSS